MSYYMKCSEPGLVLVCGSATIAHGTGDVGDWTLTSGHEYVESINQATDGEGDVVITLQDSWKGLEFASLVHDTVANGTAGAASMIFLQTSEDVDHATTPVINFQCKQIGDGTDLEPTDTAKVRFMLILKESVY